LFCLAPAGWFCLALTGWFCLAPGRMNGFVTIKRVKDYFLWY